MIHASVNLIDNARKHLGQALLYLMLGFILGFLMFYRVFPYFSSPFSSEMPTWLFVIFLIGIGGVSGILYPDITNMLVGAIALPLLGAMFCFAIFMSPSLSPDILASGLGEDFAFLARILLFDMLMVFLVTFISGFAAIYFFESSE